MTDLKFAILKKLYSVNDRRMNEIDLVNAFPNEKCNVYRELKKFSSQGYTRKVNYEVIELTGKGEDLYEETFDAKQKMEYLQKQNKTNRTIAIISVVAASIAALVPAIEFILSLFG